MVVLGRNFFFLILSVLLLLDSASAYVESFEAYVEGVRAAISEAEEGRRGSHRRQAELLERTLGLLSLFQQQGLITEADLLRVHAQEPDIQRRKITELVFTLAQTRDPLMVAQLQSLFSEAQAIQGRPLTSEEKSRIAEFQARVLSFQAHTGSDELYLASRLDGYASEFQRVQELFQRGAVRLEWSDFIDWNFYDGLSPSVSLPIGSVQDIPVETQSEMDRLFAELGDLDEAQKKTLLIAANDLAKGALQDHQISGPLLQEALSYLLDTRPSRLQDFENPSSRSVYAHRGRIYLDRGDERARLYHVFRQTLRRMAYDQRVGQVSRALDFQGRLEATLGESSRAVLLNSHLPAANYLREQLVPMLVRAEQEGRFQEDPVWLEHRSLPEGLASVQRLLEMAVTDDRRRALDARLETIFAERRGENFERLGDYSAIDSQNFMLDHLIHTTLGSEAILNRSSTLPENIQTTEDAAQLFYEVIRTEIFSDQRMYGHMAQFFARMRAEVLEQRPQESRREWRQRVEDYPIDMIPAKFDKMVTAYSALLAAHVAGLSEPMKFLQEKMPSDAHFESLELYLLRADLVPGQGQNLFWKQGLWLYPRPLAADPLRDLRQVRDVSEPLRRLITQAGRPALVREHLMDSMAWEVVLEGFEGDAEKAKRLMIKSLMKSSTAGDFVQKLNSELGNHRLDLAEAKAYQFFELSVELLGVRFVSPDISSEQVSNISACLPAFRQAWRALQ